jgi:hypothetical protein
VDAKTSEPHVDSAGVYRRPPLARPFCAFIPFRSTAFGKIRIVFALGWITFLAFLFLRSGPRDAPGLMWAFLATFVLALIWWSLVLCVNGANVVVRDEHVCTTYGPIPWLRRRNGPHRVRSLSRFRVELSVSRPRWLGWVVLASLIIPGVVVLLLRYMREPIWCIVADDELGERVRVADGISTKAQAVRLFDGLQRALVI